MTPIQNETKLSYVFPGQGSQSVGMGAQLFVESAAAKEVFQEADEILNYSLSDLMFNGPENELRDTVNSQPAIMVVSLACWKAWEEFLGAGLKPPQSIAGHSLGEYTALVVSGVLSFSDGLLLVKERGRLMQEASVERPGGMAAILGLDEDSLEHVCSETGVELANINSDDQMVISGEKIAVAQAMDLCIARGAKKAIPLPVSGAFHSSLMKHAARGLEQAITSMDFKDPKMPIVGNYTGTPLNTADEVKQELTDGLCNRVQWKKSICCMVDSGVSTFVEFGSARVLSSLIRRIDSGVEALTLSSVESIKKLTERSS